MIIGGNMHKFDRLILQIGNTKFEKIKNANILIVGIGGVGGYTLETLIRSGIHNITIVDNDVIDETNINRQIIATVSNIGEYKVDVFYKRIKEINENVNVTKVKEFITKENIETLFNNKYDYIIDTCDTIETKLELIRMSIKKNIKIISCMGTGNKLDSSKLKITDIRKTSYDPIAKIIRKMIKDERINKKIPVVYSEEQPIKVSSKTISSNSFVPATAGLLITNYIINEIIED